MPQRSKGGEEHTVTTRHAPLHDNSLLALPRMQDRHARDRAAGLQRNRIDRVVGADDEREVRVPGNRR